MMPAEVHPVPRKPDPALAVSRDHGALPLSAASNRASSEATGSTMTAPDVSRIRTIATDEPTSTALSKTDPLLLTKTDPPSPHGKG